MDTQSDAYKGLQDVLQKLPEHNLEGRITYEKSDPLSTYGGSSDIYRASFITDAIVRSCLVCHASKESQDAKALTCNQCKNIWSGKLAVKKSRARVQSKEHGKVCNRTIFFFLQLLRFFLGHSQRTYCLFRSFAFQRPPLHWLYLREGVPCNYRPLAGEGFS